MKKHVKITQNMSIRSIFAALNRLNICLTLFPGGSEAVKFTKPELINIETKNTFKYIKAIIVGYATSKKTFINPHLFSTNAYETITIGWFKGLHISIYNQDCICKTLESVIQDAWSNLSEAAKKKGIEQYKVKDFTHQKVALAQDSPRISIRNTSTTSIILAFIVPRGPHILTQFFGKTILPEEIWFSWCSHEGIYSHRLCQVSQTRYLKAILQEHNSLMQTLSIIPLGGLTQAMLSHSEDNTTFSKDFLSLPGALHWETTFASHLYGCFLLVVDSWSCNMVIQAAMTKLESWNNILEDLLTDSLFTEYYHIKILLPHP